MDAVERFKVYAGTLLIKLWIGKRGHQGENLTVVFRFYKSAAGFNDLFYILQAYTMEFPGFS